MHPRKARQDATENTEFRSILAEASPNTSRITGGCGSCGAADASRGSYYWPPCTTGHRVLSGLSSAPACSSDLRQCFRVFYGRGAAQRLSQVGTTDSAADDLRVPRPRQVWNDLDGGGTQWLPERRGDQTYEIADQLGRHRPAGALHHEARQALALDRVGNSHAAELITPACELSRDSTSAGPSRRVARRQGSGTSRWRDGVPRRPRNRGSFPDSARSTSSPTSPVILAPESSTTSAYIPGSGPEKERGRSGSARCRTIFRPPAQFRRSN